MSEHNKKLVFDSVDEVIREYFEEFIDEDSYIEPGDPRSEGEKLAEEIVETMKMELHRVIEKVK